MPLVAKEPLETEKPPGQTIQTLPPAEEPNQEPLVPEETKSEERREDNPT